MYEKEFDTLYPILNAISPLSCKVWNQSKDFFHLKTLKKGEHLFFMEDIVKDFYFLIGLIEVSFELVIIRLYGFKTMLFFLKSPCISCLNTGAV